MLHHRITKALYAFTGITMIVVAIFGAVPVRFGAWWLADSVAFWIGGVAALASIFTRRWFYIRVGAISFPWMVRGALYFATPDALPHRNEWAAGAINLLVGVSIVLIEARGDADSLWFPPKERDA